MDVVFGRIGALDKRLRYGGYHDAAELTCRGSCGRGVEPGSDIGKSSSSSSSEYSTRGLRLRGDVSGVWFPFSLGTPPPGFSGDGGTV